MSHETSQVIDLGHGVQQQWLSDGRIMHIKIPNSTREVDRIAVDTLTEYFKSRDGSVPALVAIEVTKNHLMTPYGRQRFSELPTAIHPTTYGRYGVIIPPGILGMTVRLFAMVTFRNAVPVAFEGKTHANLEDSLAWLNAYVTQPTDPKGQ